MRKIIASIILSSSIMAQALDITLPTPIATGEQVTSIRVDYGPNIESFIQCARPFVDGVGFGWELIPGTVYIHPVNQSGEAVVNLGWNAVHVNSGNGQFRASREQLIISAQELGVNWETASGATINQIVAYTFAKMVAVKYVQTPEAIPALVYSILQQLQ